MTETDASAPLAHSIFGNDWIVMADAGGQVPPLTSFAHAAKAMRNLILSAWEGPIPEMVSGHAPDGSPSRVPHLAIVPLAQVGTDQADGRLMGLAIVLPHRAAAPLGAALRGAVRECLDRLQARSLPMPMTLTLGDLGAWCIEIRRPPHGLVHNPARYAGPSRLWATITPIVLDRFPKARLPAEAIVADASRRIGLPRPFNVRLSRMSQTRGVPASRASNSFQDARAWSLPTRRDASPRPIEAHLITHAIIEYREPVCGPVLLGAGRFVGLGLCQPIDPASRVRD
jgi:CRISPR-associated protein Csb2